MRQSAPRACAFAWGDSNSAVASAINAGAGFPIAPDVSDSRGKDTSFGERAISGSMMAVAVPVAVTMFQRRRFNRNLTRRPRVALLQPTGEESEACPQRDSHGLPPEIAQMHEAEKPDRHWHNLRPNECQQNAQQRGREPTAFPQRGGQLLPVDSKETVNEPE